MKKLIFSLLLLIATSAFVLGQPPASAPDETPFFQGGIKAGLDLTKVSGLSFEQAYRFNFCAGGYGTFQIHGLFSLQPELLFSQASANTVSGFTDLYSKYGSIDLQRPHLDYLSIPVLLNFGGDQLKFQLGPQFSILTNSNLSFWTNDKQAFKSSNYAFDIGLWINLPHRLSASVRYVAGIDNINDIDKADNWKTQDLQICVGFRL